MFMLGFTPIIFVYDDNTCSWDEWNNLTEKERTKIREFKGAKK